MQQIPVRLLLYPLLLLTACTPSHYLQRAAKKDILSSPEMASAHVGITLYDPATGKYVYDFQGDKYFTPASNTKIFSCYAGLKYLGDSLPGIQYTEDDTALYLFPTGDPTLLHPDYKRNPVISFLQKTKRSLYITDANWKETAFGAGWSWGDYNDYYMPERSPLPVYGNYIRWIQERDESLNDPNGFDQSVSVYSLPEISWPVQFNPDTQTKNFYVQRDFLSNRFTITQGLEKKKEQEVPFITGGLQAALELLPDTVGRTIRYMSAASMDTSHRKTIFSQPLDSMLMPMMHRSDNFFAEQTLLMVSNRLLGVMDDSKITDTLLKTVLAGLPQAPRWADGSGLSRYNLFSPRDFVWVLNKINQEFGMDRIKGIFASGGTGTLRNYYKNMTGKLYAKTGTLSGVVCLSGYLYTKKNRLLLFSVLVNNHHGSATAIRQQVATFIEQVYERM